MIYNTLQNFVLTCRPILRGREGKSPSKMTDNSATTDIGEAFYPSGREFNKLDLFSHILQHINYNPYLEKKKEEKNLPLVMPCSPKIWLEITL